jgi:hypothetical protein
MIRGRVPVAGLAAVGVVLAAQVSEAAGLRGVGDGWLAAPADVVAAMTATGTRPRSVGGGAWVALGQTRLWGMAELPVREISAGLRLVCGDGAVGIGAGWQRTGEGPFVADRATVGLAWEGTWGVRLSGSRTTLRLDRASGPARTRWLVAAGPTIRLGSAGQLRLRAVVSLAAVDPGTRDPQPLGRLVLAHAGTVLALAWERRAGAAPTVGGEVCAAASARVALGFRFDGASRSFGPELAVRFGSALVRTSHVAHPALGVTHRVQLVAGAGRAAVRIDP